MANNLPIVAEEEVKKINTKLQCSICLSQFKEPKVLPCFHVFCMTPCLKELVVEDETSKSITCPTCRNVATLSEGGVADLQTDFYVDHLFEVREALAKAHESNCEKCKKFQAVGYCRECQNFVCENCSEMHKMWDELAEHQIVPMLKVTADTTVLAPSKQTPRCEQHPTKKLKIYCNSCSKLICTVCSMNYHKGHYFELVQDAFDKHRHEIAFRLQPIEEKLTTIGEALVAFDTRAKEINDQKVAVETDINEEIQDLHKKLDQRNKELLLNLETKTQSKLQELSANRESVEMLQLQMTTCLEYANSGLKNGTEGEVMSIKGPVLKRVGEVTKKFSTTIIEPQTKADMKLALSGKDAFIHEVEEKIHGEVKKPEMKSKPTRMVFRGHYSPTTGESQNNYRTKLMLVARKLHPNTLPQSVLLDTIDSFLPKKIQQSKSIQLYATGNTQTIIAGLKERGTLNDYIQSNRNSLTLSQVMKLASQIAEVMACLEEHGYIHRDLALRNIVVGQEHFCLLGELRQVREGGSFKASTCDKFAIKWTAPEAMFQNRFTIKSDIWSFGILLYELATFGRFPYPGISNAQVIEKLKEGYRMSKPLFCPESLYKIMLNCWNEDPSKRPTFETLQWQLEEFFETDDYVSMTPTTDVVHSPATTTL